MEDKSDSDSSGSGTKVTEESEKSPIHVGAQRSDDSKISIETGPSTAEDKSIQSKITVQESNEPTKGTKDKESEVSDSSKSEIAEGIVPLKGATKRESNLGEGGSRDMKQSAGFDQTEHEKGRDSTDAKAQGINPLEESKMFSGSSGSGIRKNVAQSQEVPVHSEIPTSSATDPNFRDRETGQAPGLLISTSGNGPKVIPTASTDPNAGPSLDPLIQFIDSEYRDDMKRIMKMNKEVDKDKSWKKSFVDHMTYFDPLLPKDSIGYEGDNEDSILSPNDSSDSNMISSIQDLYAGPSEPLPGPSEPLPGPSSGDSKIDRILSKAMRDISDYYLTKPGSGETGETAVTQTSVATEDKPSASPEGDSATGDPITCSINIAHLVNISRPSETSESEAEPIFRTPMPQSSEEKAERSSIYRMPRSPEDKAESSSISPMPQSSEENAEGSSTSMPQSPEEKAEGSPISPMPQSPEKKAEGVPIPGSSLPRSMEIEPESASGTASRVVSREEKGVSGVGSSLTQSGAAASGPGPSVTQSPQKVGGAESRKRSKVLKPDSVPETGPSSIKKYRGTE